MRIGLWIPAVEKKPLEETLERYAQAERDGFATAWTPQMFGPDALTMLALGGKITSRIELGTSVVPTFPRHPVALAQQALTVQAATGGRLALGLGLSHQVVIEGMLGLSYKKPARHMREYLTILRDLRDTGKASFEGETYRVGATARVAAETPFPIIVAALGPRMLAIAGELGDGTITWMVGPETLASHIVPGITKSAAQAGHPAPRVVAALPVCVTDDAPLARKTAAEIFAMYGGLPSYRAMLDREGAGGPEDVSIVGSEKEVRDALKRMADAGATDFGAAIFPAGPDAEASQARTYAFLASLGGKLG
ncbi:MAG: TIGR03564 family F420-dependent LLM class oxidoreductase [Myxococcota bacterium]